MCQLYSNCMQFGGIRGEFAGFSIWGVEEAGTGLDMCKQRCDKDSRCSQVVHWPMDDSCELCLSSSFAVNVTNGGGVMNKQTPVMFQKVVNIKLPLNGWVKNVFLWNRTLSAAEIVLAQKTSLCQDDGCHITNAMMSAEKQSMCGAWGSSGDFSWPTYGGKLFLRCSSCGYPQPVNIQPDPSQWVAVGWVMAEVNNATASNLTNGQFSTSNDVMFNRYEGQVGKAIYFSFASPARLKGVKIAAGNAKNAGPETPAQIEVWIWNSDGGQFELLTVITYVWKGATVDTAVAQEFPIDSIRNVSMVKLVPQTSQLGGSSLVVLRQVAFRGIPCNCISFQNSAFVSGAVVHNNLLNATVGQPMLFSFGSPVLLNGVLLALGNAVNSGPEAPKDIQIWGALQSGGPFDLITTVTNKRLQIGLEAVLPRLLDVDARKGYAFVQIVPTSNYGDPHAAVFRTLKFSGVVVNSGTGAMTVDGDLRIVPLTAAQTQFGRLEVYHSGVWGTVCADGFSHAAAAVACRQVGFAGGDVAGLDCSTQLNAQGQSLCGLSSQRVWLDDVTCVGNEDQLLSCPRVEWAGADKCPHSRDVLISCSTTSASNLLQLGEGFDLSVELGTGSMMSTQKVTIAPDAQKSPQRLGPVPVPAVDKPVHEEYQISCSPVRRLQAENVICFPAKSSLVVYQRCVADFCLTGSSALAAVNLSQLSQQQQQAQLVAQQSTLLNTEEILEEQSQAANQANVNTALAKQMEQDGVVQGAFHARVTAANQPCPP